MAVVWNCEAIIWDMDGVLIDSEPAWRAVEKHCFKEVGFDLTEKDLDSTTGLRIDAGNGTAPCVYVNSRYSHGATHTRQPTSTYKQSYPLTRCDITTANLLLVNH